jgi:hypothetical protein
MNEDLLAPATGSPQTQQLILGYDAVAIQAIGNWPWLIEIQIAPCVHGPSVPMRIVPFVLRFCPDAP